MSGHRRVPLTAEIERAIVERYEGGETLEAVCRALHIGYAKAKPVLSRYGVTLRTQLFTLAESEAAFWAKVDKGDPARCWPFTGFRDRHGYGRTRVAGERTASSRAVFFYTHGHWPNIARHTCDNPPCCNPAHIIDGSHLENMRDRDTRNRVAFGSRSGKAKLTESDVQDIRTLVGLCRISDLARAYGISHNTIAAIKGGNAWRRAC